MPPPPRDSFSLENDMYRRSGLLFLSVLFLAGCGSSSDKTGDLSIAVTGLPAGLSGAVQVQGPGGAPPVAVTSTTTLLGLAPGTYTITATPRYGTGAIVPPYYVATATPASVTVTAGATSTATVEYRRRPGSGKLWFATSGGLQGWSDAALALATPAADASFTFDVDPGLSEGGVLDHDGNLWGSYYGNNLVELTTTQLEGSSPVTPWVTISSNVGPTNISNPIGLGIDKGGNLWVASRNRKEVVRFAPTQLSLSGSPMGSVVFSNTAADGLSDPWGLAFDSAGNLWIGNESTNSLSMFTPAQQVAGGAVAPAVNLVPQVAFGRPTGLAFDATGKLWVGDTANGTVFSLTPAQLSAGGNQTPDVILTLPGSGFVTSLAFDGAGDLWVSRGGSAFEIPSSQLTVTGIASESKTVALGPADISQLVFDPTPAGLPLLQK